VISNSTYRLHTATDDFGISLRDILSDGNRFEVYRGTADTPVSPSVIVAMNDDGAEAWVSCLEEEVRMYRNELRQLQGRVVHFWVLHRHSR
jgi:hypothetical protein